MRTQLRNTDVFIIVDSVKEQEYYQGYGHNDPGGYSPVTRLKVYEFKTETELLNHLDRRPIEAGNTRKVFQAEELAIKTTVTVALATKAQNA